MKLTIIIPTLNAGSSVSDLLSQLAGKSVVVTDGGSDDDTLDVAIRLGASVAAGSPGRGQQLARGADWAIRTQNPYWLLFVHADCALPENWQSLTQDHMRNYPHAAAYFAFGARAKGWRPRFMEWVVALRDIWPLLPYGDQGLLISRQMYEAVGGIPPQSLFEDVEIIRAIKGRYGRRGLRKLRGRINSDVGAYERDGFARRTWRNVMIIRAYNKGSPIEELIARYRRPS